MDLAKIRKKHKKADETVGKVNDIPFIDTVGKSVVSSKAFEAEPIQAVADESPMIDIEPVSEDISFSEELALVQDKTFSEELVDFIIFPVGDEEFAFRVDEIAEILKDQIITFVPRGPDFLLGVTSMNGKIIPVIDPAKRLCVPEREPEAEVRKRKRKILIIKGSKGYAGLMISGAMNVLGVQVGLIQTPPAHLGEQGRAFVESVLNVSGRFISVLRMQDLLDF